MAKRGDGDDHDFILDLRRTKNRTTSYEKSVSDALTFTLKSVAGVQLRTLYKARYVVLYPADLDVDGQECISTMLKMFMASVIEGVAGNHMVMAPGGFGEENPDEVSYSDRMYDTFHAGRDFLVKIVRDRLLQEVGGLIVPHNYLSAECTPTITTRVDA